MIQDSSVQACPEARQRDPAAHGDAIMDGYWKFCSARLREPPFAIPLDASRDRDDDGGGAARIAGWVRRPQTVSPPLQSRCRNTTALEWPEEDLSGRLMDGAHRFVERADRRDPGASRIDSGSTTARRPPPGTPRCRAIAIACARSSAPSIRVSLPRSNASATTTIRRWWRRQPHYRVWQVRWPVLDGMTAEGLLVEPTAARRQRLSSPCPMPGRPPNRSSASHPGWRQNVSSPGSSPRAAAN